MFMKQKIMVVDGEPDHVELCSRILERKGYQVQGVVGCKALEELLEAVLTFQPDLVFVDHTMPHICGTDAVRMLKANPITKNIPIIYFSAHQDIAVLAEIAGADGLLRKPFDAEGLLQTIDYYS
jgi:CheY-like chemotaxis protein